MPMLPGTWTDVSRRGRIVRTVGASVWTEDAAIPAPDTLMFLRADEDASGKLVIVGKAHSDGRAWLWREAGQTWVCLGATVANHCVETDGRCVWVQRTSTSYDVIDLNPGGTSYSVTCPATSQGFCDVTVPAGISIMSDDRRSAVEGIYRPQYAGPWWVGGARETYDVLAVQHDVARLVAANVAPVEETRAAWVNGELICCAYVAAGVWVWRGTPTEIAPPVPETWTESPVGTLVTNTAQYATGSQGDWARDGTHRMDCTRSGDAVYFVKFSEPRSYEQWGLDAAGNVWHCFDASGTGGNDARGDGYQWSAALWIASQMRVGDRLDATTNEIRWLKDGQWGPWAPFPLAITLDAHRTRSDGVSEIEWGYHYGPGLSVREIYKGRSDLGWWSWTLEEQGATHHSEWPTPVNATPLRPASPGVPWPDARPMNTTPEEPEKPPVPAEPVITDPEFANAGGRIEFHYASRPERYPVVREVRTDELSYRWMVDYYTLRRTLPHEAAIQEVERRMAKAAGEVPPTPPVGAGLVGALRVSDV